MNSLAMNLLWRQAKIQATSNKTSNAKHTNQNRRHTHANLPVDFC